MSPLVSFIPLLCSVSASVAGGGKAGRPSLSLKQRRSMQHCPASAPKTETEPGKAGWRHAGEAPPAEPEVARRLPPSWRRCRRRATQREAPRARAPSSPKATRRPFAAVGPSEPRRRLHNTWISCKARVRPLPSRALSASSSCYTPRRYLSRRATRPRQAESLYRNMPQPRHCHAYPRYAAAGRRTSSPARLGVRLPRWLAAHQRYA